MRRSGVLMHITSLPSPGGIGTLGSEAREFATWLKEAGMSVWQVLPVGPTGFGSSPYQSPCTHAGNVFMIDLRDLVRDGLLSESILEHLPPENEPTDAARNRKIRLLKQCFYESREKLRPMVEEFVQTHPAINDYALFMAVKDYFGGKMWSYWPDVSIRFREETAMDHYSRVLKDDIEYYKFLQYLFFRQWKALKDFVNGLGIQFLGDLPIYVAEDSSDAWANPEVFQLDQDRRPIKVAGVPPDYFAKDGQLWGNPLYNWRYLKKTGYKWWIERLKTAGELFDIIRIDHFIGFANYYAVKAGALNARNGKWEKAPGFSFFRAVKRHLPKLSIIAEDLGVVSRRVKRLLRYTELPGMKVMQFGFDSDETNPHFFPNVSENCLLYTGTHDNDTSEGWWESTKESTKEFALKYLPQREKISQSMIEAALGSVADTVIVPMQDVLSLGSEARMNTPGTVGGRNWRWRMDKDALSLVNTDSLREMNEFFGRTPREAERF